MGRTRKYLTEEARKEAERIRCKLYYEANKELLREKRRYRYAPVDVDNRIKHGKYVKEIEL